MPGPKQPKGIPATPPVRTPEQIAKAAEPREIRILDDDPEDVREMKMMRFIWSLPIIDVDLLPRYHQDCSLCDKPYEFDWKIEGPETAIVLPCGHIVGSYCISVWLSPYGKKHTNCPHLGCGARFPCPMSKNVENTQTIVDGRLHPSPFLNLPGRRGFIDVIKEDDEASESGSSSVITQIHIDELAASAHASDIKRQDPTRQLKALTPAIEVNEEFEGLTLELLNKKSSATVVEAEKPKVKTQWTLLRNVMKFMSLFTVRSGQEPIDHKDSPSKPGHK